MSEFYDIVFDGLPGDTIGPGGPLGPRLVEVEDDQGRSVSIPLWVQRPDGYWVLRITKEIFDEPHA